MYNCTGYIGHIDKYARSMCQMDAGPAYFLTFIKRERTYISWLVLCQLDASYTITWEEETSLRKCTTGLIGVGGSGLLGLVPLLGSGPGMFKKAGKPEEQASQLHPSMIFTSAPVSRFLL